MMYVNWFMLTSPIHIPPMLCPNFRPVLASASGVVLACEYYLSYISLAFFSEVMLYTVCSA